MRFIHITDTHVGPTPDYTLHGNPALPILKALVDTINNLPFRPDFVLHTGDVVNDRQEASYDLAKSVLDRLKFPVYYVVGNHDQPDLMQRVLLGQTLVGDRFDYTVDIDGIRLAVFDSRGSPDPAGTLTAKQLEMLRDLCQPAGPPLIIALHHQPVWLDSTWLDEPWTGGQSMPLDCGEAFREAIAPARDRIRGVFFGHVHRGFQVFRDGILYCSAPSALLQFESWPGQREIIPARAELPEFGVVTVTPTQTIIRQYTFARPD
jgi:Icc protein